ncbi:hypothetical protein [Streptomyces sp. JB150]|uniref:hypothetical protein n=1 Tax=Streptomyces sp. JB150 TaxID=2714844 RepID=UPI0014075DEF|nr:hypothetical protein [Streptomyces sp. JB150]QIJ61442.1 hypothetical protein G7Z13_04870 [Streptomyces sp. JB150]
MTDQPTLTPDPDRNGIVLHLPEITYLDTQVWAVDVGLTREGLAALRALLTAPADRAAVLRDAADDLATAFGDPMVKHIGALGASHLRRRAREIDARQGGRGTARDAAGEAAPVQRAP